MPGDPGANGDSTSGATSALNERLRALPAIAALLERDGVKALVAQHGHNAVTYALRAAVQAARERVLAGGEPDVSDAHVELELTRAQRGTLRPVLNAAGVVVHTNLGRAPLAEEALQAVREVGGSYSTLEYDLDAGRRGSRHGHAVPLLRELTGAEDACVVNNNAAAVLLALSAIADGREVLVSRGELVEIGGGFRVPDIIQQGGARLVEVGTTNRTRVADFEAALSEHTGMLLTVHRSNFAQVGFTEDPPLKDLAQLARAHDVPYLFDAGSGALEPVPQAGDEELPVRRVLAAGVDLVSISGDKLLGGPQAGILLGKRELVQKARKHPLMRALRPDKLCLAALVATLQLWRDRPERVPVARMIRTSAGELQTRAERVAATLGDGAEVVATHGRIGGGSSPLVELDSRAVALPDPDPDALATRLRAQDPPVVARIEDGRVLLDLLAVPPSDDDRLIASARAAREVGDG